MGGFCAQSYTNLPSYTETVGGTTLPAWVSAGGKALFENAAQSLDLHTHSILAQE